MKLEQFAMERMQSTYENQVEFNLSESGVQPLRLAELVDDEAARNALMTEALRYTQSNGTEPLRSDIAALYSGADADRVPVTNGGSEANYITTRHPAERSSTAARRRRCGAARIASSSRAVCRKRTDCRDSGLAGSSDRPRPSRRCGRITITRPFRQARSAISWRGARSRPRTAPASSRGRGRF